MKSFRNQLYQISVGRSFFRCNIVDSTRANVGPSVHSFEVGCFFVLRWKWSIPARKTIMKLTPKWIQHGSKVRWFQKCVGRFTPFFWGERGDPIWHPPMSWPTRDSNWGWSVLPLNFLFFFRPLKRTKTIGPNKKKAQDFLVISQTPLFRGFGCYPPWNEQLAPESVDGWKMNFLLRDGATFLAGANCY